MITEQLLRRLQSSEARVAAWMARQGVGCMRLSLGIIFFWFGALKLFPGASPAEGLVGETILALSFGHVPPELSVPALGAFEALLGISFLTGYGLRITILVLLGHMAGTASPLFLLPDVVFGSDLLSLTLEGQYIVKNLVLISGALVVGASIRGRTISSVGPDVLQVRTTHSEGALPVELPR